MPNTMTTTLSKRTAVLLMALLTAHPALAQTMQYRIPLFGSGYALPQPTPNPGAGEGDVDTGENPVEVGPPQIKVHPSALQFEVVPGTPFTSLKALVVNTGNVPTTVTGISSNEHFDVTHSCAGTLPVGAACQVSATPTVKASGALTYNMVVNAPGAPAPEVLSLSTYQRAAEVPTPRLALSDDMVGMGPLKPGERTNKSVYLTNVGTATALLGGISSGAGFTVTDNCPDTLEAGAFCTITADFASYAAKTHSHSMNLTSGQAGHATTLTFYAEVLGDPAIMPALEFDQNPVRFGPMDAGTSETKKVVLTNHGTAPALLSGIEATAPFSLTSGCPGELAVGASCNIIVTFNAFTQGTTPAQWMTAKAQNDVSARTLLQGQVNGGDSQAPKLVFAPEFLDFGDLAVGQSASLESVVTNEGPSDAKLSSLKVDVGAANFSQTNDCPATLASGQSCRVTATFKATAAKSRGGRLSVAMSNGPAGALPLAGRGQQALLGVGPVDVNFGAVTLPGTSAVHTVSLSNSGNMPLTGLSIANNNSRLTIGYGSCTETLEAKKGCTLSLTYAPGTTGPFEGQFTVSSANGGSAVVKWYGSAVKLTTSPSSLTFPETPLGTSAPDQVVTLTNSGAQAIQIAALGILSGSAHFGQSNNCGASLAAGGSCSVQVRYTPSTAREHGGSLGVTVNGTLVGHVTLSGSAIRPELLLSKSSLQFAPTNVGQRSETLNFTVSNPSAQLVDITGMSITTGAAEFGQSNNCGVSLAPKASCTVSVQLVPTTKNGSNGTWSVVSSLGTQTVTLVGQGTAPAGGIEADTGTPGIPPILPGDGGTSPVDDGFTHYSISFLNTEVGASSAVRHVKFSNKGDGPLKIQGLSISAGETDFAQTNNCSGTLAPGAYCTISLLFTPTALGTRTGGIALLSDGGQFYFNLTGQGIGAVGAWRADSSADFGSVGVSTTAQRSFTFSNTGTVAAREVAAELTGTQLRLVSNTCGAAGSAVPLPVGGSCRMTVEYAPTAPGALEGATLTMTGTLANGPVVLALTGNAPAPALTFDALPSGNFGSTTTGVSTSRTYYLRNTGMLPDTLTSLETEGSSFTLSGGTCKSGLVMAPSGVCSVSVLLDTPSTGQHAGTLLVTSAHGATTTLNLSADAKQSVYAISSLSTSMAAPVTDFGVLTANSGNKLVKTYYLRDNTSSAVIAANTIALSSDGSFSITGVSIVGKESKPYAFCTTSATSLSAPCIAPEKDYAIGVTVQFSPVTVGDKTATLRFEHNGTGGVSEIALSGKSEFNTEVNWSVTQTALVEPTEASLAYGTLSRGNTLDKTLFVRNIGTRGAQAVGFALSGDTSQFKIVEVKKARQNASGLSNYVSACVTGGLISNNGSSATPCLAADIAGSVTGHAGVYVTLRYAPASLGDHTVTITPVTDNGTVLPAPLSLTGSSAFNPNAAWSSSPTALVAPAPAALSYGTVSQGLTLDKTIYIRNVGQYGAQSVGLALAGDVSQFQILEIKSARQDRSGSNSHEGACYAGGAIAGDRHSVSPCLASDVAYAGRPGVFVTLRYSPTTQGSHSVTLTPTTDNGTVLPAPISLSGSAILNPSSSWSTAPNGLLAPTAAALSYGTVTTGATLDKGLFLRNTGTNGGQSVGLALTGDTTHFKLVSLKRVRQDKTSITTTSCAAGGTVALDQLSAVPCLADDPSQSTYSGVYVVVRYAPQGAGTHSVSVAPSSNNGTELPETLLLTGSSP